VTACCLSLAWRRAERLLASPPRPIRGVIDLRATPMPLNAPTSPLRSPPALSPLLLLASLLAACVPTLLAYNQPPSATLINQCLALTLWGGVVLAAPPTALPRASAALLAALGLMALAALGSWGLGSLPLSLAGLAIGLLAGAALLVATAATRAHSSRLHK
jgi:hypothetical protein